MTTRPRLPPPRPRRRRSGLTLLEVLAASVVIALALAPALRVTRTALLTADRTDRQERCLTVANDRLEYLMARVAADWDATVTGAAATQAAAVPGYPGLRFTETASDAAPHDGLPGRLATVAVAAWYDDDGDATLDAGEPQARLATQVARLTAYELHVAP